MYKKDKLSIKKHKKGFIVQPSKKYIKKFQRENKIKELKSKSSESTIKDIKEYLDVTNDRLSEIYEMLEDILNKL